MLDLRGGASDVVALSVAWQALGFAIAIAYWPGLLSGAFAPRWAVIAVGAPALLLLWPPRIPRWVWPPLAGISAWAAASLLWTPDRAQGVADLFILAASLMVFLAAMGLPDLSSPMTGLCLGLLPSSLLCVAQIFGLDWPWQAAVPAGLFLNREVLAEFAAPLLVWAFLSRRFLLASVPAVPLILCQSRIAACALALGLIWPVGGRLRTLLLAGFALSASGACLILGSDKAASFAERIRLWDLSIDNLSFRGQGIGWFMAVHPLQQYAHSDALQYAVELGLPSALLLVLAILAYRHGRDEVARSVFISLGAEAAVSFPLHLPAGAFVAAVVGGYLARGGGGIFGSRDRSRHADGKRLRWSEPLDGRDAGYRRPFAIALPLRDPSAPHSRRAAGLQ